MKNKVISILTVLFLTTVMVSTPLPTYAKEYRSSVDLTSNLLNECSSGEGNTNCANNNAETFGDEKNVSPQVSQSSQDGTGATGPPGPPGRDNVYSPKIGHHFLDGDYVKRLYELSNQFMVLSFPLSRPLGTELLDIPRFYKQIVAALFWNISFNQ